MLISAFIQNIIDSTSNDIEVKNIMFLIKRLWQAMKNSNNK